MIIHHVKNILELCGDSSDEVVTVSETVSENCRYIESVIHQLGEAEKGIVVTQHQNTLCIDTLQHTTKTGWNPI
jgi:hypothetical protein